MPKKAGPAENNGEGVPRLRASLEGKFLIATLLVILTTLLPLTIAFFLTVDTIKRESIDLFNREAQAGIIVERLVLASQQMSSTDLPLIENLRERNAPESLRLIELRRVASEEVSAAADDYLQSYSFAAEPRILDLLMRKNQQELADNEKSLVESIELDAEQLNGTQVEAEELVRAEKFEEASTLLRERIVPLQEKILRSANALSRHVSTVIALLTNAAEDLTSQLVTSTLAIVLFSVLLAVGISVILVRHLTRPLRAIGEFADEIAHGNYDARAPELTQDEIGALGSAVDHMRGKIQRFVVQLQSSYEHEVEHLKEIAALKDQFAFIAAHELKTPVAAIRWNLDLIQESAAFKKLPSDLQESAQNVQSSVIRLNALVNDLLHVSRLEKGTVKSSLQAVDPKQAVEETIKELDYLAHDRGVTVSYQPPKETVRFRADPLLFREVVQNLISNAIKYNRTKGRVFIRVNTADSRGWVEVEDQGMGFTPAERKNVYRRFWRSERVGDIEGTGLGLYIVKQFVNMMKGTIDLKSRPGAGSTFRVTLPLAKK